MALTQEEITKLNAALEKCTRAALVTEQILDEIQNNSDRSEDIATAQTRLKADYIATETSRGFSKPDGITIEVDDTGTLSAVTATTTSLGIVKPDDTSLQIDGTGTLSIKTADATTEASGFMSSSDKTKLNGIEAGAQVNTVTGVKGNNEGSYRTGNVNITKANINLGNVDNTHDIDKNVATAQTLATPRNIALSGGATGTATAFDGSKDITIPVTDLDMDKASAGTLTVDRGGTGQTTIADIKAGKDSAGNTITSTYATKEELQNLRNGLYEVVSELPVVGEAGKMYLVGVAGASGTNTYKEYIYVGNKWEETGAPELDLSNYSTKSETIRSLSVDPITGGTRITFTYANGVTDFVDVSDTVIQGATQLPQPMGTASAGSSSKYAREDHVHPAQTIDLTNYSTKANTVKDIDYSDNTLTVTKGDDTTETFTIRSGGGDSKVVSTTTITGDNNCIANKTITFTLSASSALVNTAIASFTVDGGALGKQTVNANNNSATVTFNIPSAATEGTTYNISAYATDELGNSGVEAVKVITVIAVSVATPTVTLSTNSTYLGQSVTISTSAFKITGTTDSHASTDYKVCSDSAGTNVVFQALASTDKTSHTISANNIGEGTRYIFVRHNSTNYGSSDWSTGAVLTVSAPYVNTPTISLSKTSIYTGETITLTGSTFGLNSGTGTHSKTDWKICSSSDPTATGIWSSLNDSTNKTSITVPIDSITTGTRYAFVRYYDSVYNMWSEWSSSATITVTASYVNKPSILVPTSNVEIMKTSGLTIQGSTFSITGGTDTHQSTNYKILDSSNNTVLSSLNNTTDKTSHTFSSSEISSLSNDTTYKARIQYKGTKYGLSEESSLVSFKLKAGITTPSGRTVYRHPNNKGTVIKFDMFGKAMKLFVADAAYRGTSIKFGAYNKDSSLKNYNPSYSGTNYFYSGGSETSGAAYQEGATSGTNVSAYSSLPPLTDAQLQSRLSPLSDDLTARQNCDVWMTYEGTTDSQNISGVPAVKLCRDLSLTGISGGCDLPNLYELSVIYIESDILDEMDPTLSSNSGKALSKQSNSNRWFNGSSAWSSTEHSATDVCDVYSGGLVFGNRNKHNTCCVVPVREL